MKTAVFETSTGALANLLQATPPSFVWCDTYSFALTVGATINLATGDSDITYGGVTYIHNTPAMDVRSVSGNRPTAHWKVGLDTDTWNALVFPKVYAWATDTPYPDTIGTIPWGQAVVGGMLDGATVTVNRCYFPQWPTFPRPMAITPTGAITIFLGTVGAVDIMRSAISISLISMIDLMSVQMPRNLFQAGCRHQLFDGGCTLNAASFAENGTIAAVYSGADFTATIATPGGSASYFLGTLRMTSGSNSGFQRMVHAWNPGSPSLFNLISPFPFPINPGDTFTAYPGCAKTQANCTSFGNLANFGGQSYIPIPETAL